MDRGSVLDALALLLASIHFGVPIAYYLYAKTKWLPKPWNIKVDESYKPKVTIIIPTYNEAKVIGERLNNIYEQDYSKEFMEVIVVDSASTDGTAEIVEEWFSKHKDLRLILIRESERRGKAAALNRALREASGEVVVIADADALWPSNALTKVVELLSDPSIGAVSCLKKPLGSSAAEIEEVYRQYYNVLRVAESKAYSTPIFHGELAAFKANLLKEIGGFPIDIGADDSYTASRIAIKGFRAIIPEDLWVDERVPERSYFSWKVRRAQHLIQHFAKMLRTNGMPNEFKMVLLIEGYLHLVNPWLLTLVMAILLALVILYHNLVAIIALALGLLLMAFKSYRAWIATQLCLIVGAIKNLYSKEIVWVKHSK